MRKLIPAFLLLPALGGCASILGGGGPGGSPDEFAVTRNAPLIIPPDYTLAPPVAGTVTTTNDIQQQAIEALFGGPAPRSPGETTMLEAAGRERAVAGARSVAADPNTRIVDKGNTTATILATAVGDSSVATTQVR